MEGTLDAKLADYRKSDFNRRLNMYMQYPMLRARFLEIDRGEEAFRPIIIAGRADRGKDCSSSGG